MDSTKDLTLLAETSMMNEDQESARKKDHIDLAFRSQILKGQLDDRFNYEPMLAGFPNSALQPVNFAGKEMKAPIWISSMTGGTELAGKINKNLAQACAEYGLGMGLGSCRIILEDDTYFEDFNLRPIIGRDNPFYANLGIAQVEQLLAKGEGDKIASLVYKLKADGLFIHVNPLQEWLQPEGDIIKRSPLDTVQQFLEDYNIPVIVKEVGQGMGPASLKALLQMPLAAIDFAAHGGTNFSKVELLRSEPEKQELYESVANLGHGAEEMVNLVNSLVHELGDKVQCKQLLISGGVKDFLDGYYLTSKSSLPAIYGQGSAFLKRAQISYEAVQAYVEMQIRGLQLAQAYLTVK